MERQQGKGGENTEKKKRRRRALTSPSGDMDVELYWSFKEPTMSNSPLYYDTTNEVNGKEMILIGRFRQFPPLNRGSTGGKTQTKV